MPTKSIRSRPIRVAIINTSVELIEALEIAMQEEGFITTSATVTDLKRHNTTLREVFESIEPDVIIYDVGIPYKENWEYLQKLRANPEIGNAQILITTTNKAALEKLIQKDSFAYEITGIFDKPFDLDTLLEAVRLAVKGVEGQKVLRKRQESKVKKMK